MAKKEPRSTKYADVLVAGSLAIDISCDFLPDANPGLQNSPQMLTSNPSFIQHHLGGTGHNIAAAVQYLGTSIKLCSAIGNDPAGSAAMSMLRSEGLPVAGIRELSGRTAQYVAVNDAKKNLVLAMADMNILEKTLIDFENLWKPHLSSSSPKWLVGDGNWDSETMQRWLSEGKAAGASIAFEPVSVAKSKRLFATSIKNEIACLPDKIISLSTPNAMELASMHSAAQESGLFERADWWRIVDSMAMSSSGSRDKLVEMTSTTLVDQGIPQQSIRLLPFIPTILTKLGSKGVLMIQMLRPRDPRLTDVSSAQYILSRSVGDNCVIGGVYIRLFPPAELIPDHQIVSVNGAGDTFLGVVVAGLAKEKQRDLTHLIAVAQKASVMTLKSRVSVSPQIASLASLL